MSIPISTTASFRCRCPRARARGVPTGGELWVISATANKENAKAFLECVSSPEMMLTYAKDRNNVPSREALWAPFNEALPRMAPFVESLAGAREPHRRSRHAVSEVLGRLFGGDAGDPDRREGAAGGARRSPGDCRIGDVEISVSCRNREPAGRHPRPAQRVAFEGSWRCRSPSWRRRVIFMVLMFGYPLFYNVWMSVTDFRVATFLTGVAPFVGLDNYIDLFRNKTFYSALWLTGIFTVISIAGQMTIGMLLALFFWRRFPLNATMRALLLAPWLLPLVVSASVWQWMFQQDYGIINYILVSLGIIDSKIPWLVDPTNALIAVIITNIWIGIPFSMAVFHSRPAGAAARRCSKRPSSTVPARCSASSSSSCRCSGR